MSKEITIKVAIRCRTFNIDDKLGVKLNQLGEETGEVELINCDYTTKRFPFTYAWWSAVHFERHLLGDNMPDAQAMELVDQNMAYQQVGLKVKNDIITGNAVVLFAYGLSGSGKTYTVFGPDASDAPEAWFKHADPHPLWGIFPRLAYELFKEKKDGWKISMKYFQNVVDTVRDLLSDTLEEQHYKNGMRKDPDGFMDIEWCQTKPINSWNELRTVFQKANVRKAIAPTQFNPMSTRGHCVLLLETEIPDEDNEGMKKRGRCYVCDLAGTEPAGDIVFAQYDKITFPDGSFEYKFKGPHPDQKKTKELQEQGKKINLSLSEMAQFFMKMAEAVKAKKLTPGMSIPGCNSFFLCKYLKDTMLQARTYLFCAIRPEVAYLKYTFATLGFARNASVVKLVPKKATMAASASERKLMIELDAMKELVAKLQADAAAAAERAASSKIEGEETRRDSTIAMDTEAARTIAELQAKLAEKQEALASEVNEDTVIAEAKAKQQREEFAKKGIALATYESQTVYPYFINIDEDAFRSNRFMFIINKENTVFGNKGDIQPMSLAVVREHCSVRFDNANNAVFLTAGKGDTWRNGHRILAGAEEKLAIFDRVAMGDQLMLFRWNGHEEGKGFPMSADDAVGEFQDGLVSSRNAGSGSASTSADQAALELERKKIMEERARWEKEKSDIKSVRQEEEYQAAMKSVDNAILDLLPKVKEAKQTVDLLNRVNMVFDVVLEKGTDHVPRVKISITNKNPHLSILLEPQVFLPKLALLKDEMMRLRTAIDAGREYQLPERQDPLYLMFDNDYLLGSATSWPEYLLYNLETDNEEAMQEIKNAAVPYNTVGLLEVKWVPLAGPSEEDEGKPPRDVEDESDLLGKPWTYRLEIKKAVDLPVFCEMAYVEYDFFGETFITEAVQQTTYSPTFDYTKVHHVPKVTPDFLAFLKNSMEMKIHVTQHIEAPTDRLGSGNAIVRESVTSGEAKGYDAIGAGDGTNKPKSDYEVKYEKITIELAESQSENDRLKARIFELERKIEVLERRDVPPASRAEQAINEAKLTDSIVNGSGSESGSGPNRVSQDIGESKGRDSPVSSRK